MELLEKRRRFWKGLWFKFCVYYKNYQTVYAWAFSDGKTETFDQVFDLSVGQSIFGLLNKYSTEVQIKFGKNFGIIRATLGILEKGPKNAIVNCLMILGKRYRRYWLNMYM